jgi:Zn-dependent M28 family amino/carboxypeptidase
MIKAGEKLQMSVNLQATYHDQDLMGYNTIAEIPGSDPKLKDEIVMLGGHMDSWHSGTGATDNAAGVAVVMEAARIIQTLGLKPRRTIRVALWSGEEQGLFGSQAYVKKHFGTRGDALQQMIAAAIGTKLDMGASTLTLQDTTGTDHLSFDGIGLPGFQFIQDQIEYDTLTHHSNQDVYDRVQSDDMKQAATIMAAFVYQTAMMDEKIPRKTLPAAQANR